MAVMELNCTFCKNRCKVEVEYEGQETISVSGNGCMRGMLFARQKVAEAEKEEE